MKRATDFSDAELAAIRSEIAADSKARRAALQRMPAISGDTVVPDISRTDSLWGTTRTIMAGRPATDGPIIRPENGENFAMQKIEWHWKGWLARGKFHLLAVPRPPENPPSVLT
jgi:hypothetical protein